MHPDGKTAELNRNINGVETALTKEHHGARLQSQHIARIGFKDFSVEISLQFIPHSCFQVGKKRPQQRERQV
jgi:hypothetical protein